MSPPVQNRPARRFELAEPEHRERAVVELAIQDLKDQALACSSSAEISAFTAVLEADDGVRTRDFGLGNLKNRCSPPLCLGFGCSDVC